MMYGIVATVCGGVKLWQGSQCKIIQAADECLRFRVVGEQVERGRYMSKWMPRHQLKDFTVVEMDSTWASYLTFETPEEATAWRMEAGL